MIIRRKFGDTLSGPIKNLVHDKYYDSLTFIEKDEKAAQKTRAAALMYIGRNDLGLTTSVNKNRIVVMKNKDVVGNQLIVDLRNAI